MSNPANVAEKWKALVERLAYNTKKGAIGWDEGSLPDSVVTSVGEVVITLREVGNDFHFLITDPLGEVIDSFSDTDLPGGVGGQSSYAFIGDLYRVVRRKISGADKILDEILAALPPEPDEIPF